MLSIVLPAYNEDQSLHSLLEGIRQILERFHIDGRVIVVNDGSTDRTGDITRSFAGVPVELIEWHPNRGLAESLKQGLARAIRNSQKGDVIITMDADNSHPPDLIPEMISKLKEGNDVVIASRYQEGSEVRGVPAVRRLLSNGASNLFRVLVPIRGVRDYTGGYRIYDAAFLKRVFERFGDQVIQQDGFGCTLELLLRMHALKPTICEVPLILRYDLKHSESKMRIWPTIKGTLRLLGRHSFGREN